MSDNWIVQNLNSALQTWSDKLAEIWTLLTQSPEKMHVDDWTIARLLGHKRLNSVKHYRKMSNQRMADETREVRQMMSDIIYSILDGWGEEYEQIRQDD